MRVPVGHHFIDDDGTVIGAGQSIEIGAPGGQQLAERGYELVSIRRVSARD